MRIQFELSFQQPVEHVFPYLADPSRWHEYSPTVVERSRVGNGPLAVGARWASVDRIGPFRIRFTDEMVELEENRRVAWMHSPPWNGRTEFRCEPEEAGTRLTVRFDARPSGRLRLLELVPDRLASRIFERDFRRARARLAAGPG